MEYTAVVIATPIASERIAKTVKSGVAPSRLRASLMSLTTRGERSITRGAEPARRRCASSDDGHGLLTTPWSGRLVDHRSRRQDRTSILRSSSRERTYWIRGEQRGEQGVARGVPPDIIESRNSFSHKTGQCARRPQATSAGRCAGYELSASGGALCRPPGGAPAVAVTNSGTVA